MHAVRGGHVAVVAALAEGGAALDAVDRKKTTALMVATMGRQHECLKVTACPDQSQALVQTHHAAQLQSWLVSVAVLLRRRDAFSCPHSSANKQIPTQHSTLQGSRTSPFALPWGLPCFPCHAPPGMAMSAGRSAPTCSPDSLLLQVLLKAGATPHLANESGMSAPMLAAHHGLLPTLQLMLACGVSPEAALDQESSPIIAACVAGQAESLRVLLRAGADPNRPDANVSLHHNRCAASLDNAHVGADARHHSGGG